MDTKTVFNEVEDKMKKSLDVVHRDFAALRTGRANPGMVDDIRVDYYGTLTPLKQMAGITVPEPKTLLINPWDPSVLKAIEKAINEANLGITPIVDGKAIRISVPPLSRERREELVKVAKKTTEDGRVSVRSLRRDANERIKQLEKEKKITEDESFKSQTDIQKLTDRYIQLIDQSQAAKEQELMQN